jgi:hypothetical protein
MTFPTPRTPEYSATTSGSSRVVDLPAGIVAGDLMVVVIAGPSGEVVTPPSGWALLAGGWGNGTDGDGIYWKIAVGGETSATWTISSSATSRHVGMAFQNALSAEYTFLNQDGGSTPNCPSITASWGLADNMFVALNYWSDASDTPTSYPASYSLIQNVFGTTTGFRVSARALAAATEDPGVQTGSGVMAGLRSVTFAIRPTVASAAQSVSRGSYMMG